MFRKQKVNFVNGVSEAMSPRCDQQQNVLKSLCRKRSLADGCGIMVLGVVCGLQKEYTTL